MQRHISETSAALTLLMSVKYKIIDQTQDQEVVWSPDKSQICAAPDLHQVTQL